MTATPDPQDGSVIAVRVEDQLLMLFDAAVASLRLNGLPASYEVLMVLKHKDIPNHHQIVGTIDWAEGRNILQHYIDKHAKADAATAAALKKLRGNNNG